MADKADKTRQAYDEQLRRTGGKGTRKGWTGQPLHPGYQKPKKDTGGKGGKK